MKTFQWSLVLLLLCVLVSTEGHPQSRLSSKSAVASSGALLPDFSRLLPKDGGAVVNVMTRSTTVLPPAGESDLVQEFFRRFLPGPRSGNELREQGLASGFIISDDGFVLTSAHVVANAEEINVRLSESKRSYRARIVGADRHTDIALLKVDGKNLPKVAIGSSEDLKVGEWVAAVGSPFGLENTITAGIVSAKGRSLPNELLVPFIQTDVAVNPGNSGGPLLNMRGEVVAINSQILSQTGGFQGISFAIPIEVAMDVVAQLREHGAVRRAHLGVQTQELTPDLAASFSLSDTNGVLIAGVEKSSAADEAGLQPGDVILRFDGSPVASATELPRRVAKVRPGTRVDLQISRKGMIKNIAMILVEASTSAVLEPSEPRYVKNNLGLVLSDIEGIRKRELRLDHGVLVEFVEGESARSGIQVGDIILALNEAPVVSSNQFQELIANRPPDKPAALLVRRGERAAYLTIGPKR